MDFRCSGHCFLGFSVGDARGSHTDFIPGAETLNALSLVEIEAITTLDLKY